MSTATDRVIQRLSLLSLVLVTTLCFYSLASVLYLRSMAEGLIPVLFLCGVVYLVSKYAQMRVLPGWNLRMPHALLAAIVLLPAVSLLGQSALNLSALDIDGRSSIFHARNFWVVGVLWLVAGAALASAFVSPSRLAALGLVGALIVLLWFGSEGLFVINYARLSAGMGGFRFSHLNTSDYAVFSLALAYGLAFGWVRVAVLVGGLFVLFALGGRGALISFALAAVLHQAFFVVHSPKMRVFSLVALVSVLVAFFGILSDMGASDLTGKDVLFSEGYRGDASVLARLDQIFFGFSDLGQQALFGDPSLIVRRFASAGAYMHNLFSSWQFYGVLFFAVLVCALFFGLKFAYLSRGVNSDVLSVTFTILIIYVAISVVVAKAVGFYLLWLALGFWLERGILGSSLGTRRFLPGGAQRT